MLWRMTHEALSLKLINKFSILNSINKGWQIFGIYYHLPPAQLWQYHKSIMTHFLLNMKTANTSHTYNLIQEETNTQHNKLMLTNLTSTLLCRRNMEKHI